MPAYMISQVTVTDNEKFQEYLKETQLIAARYGAKPVAVGKQPKMLNGEEDEHQLVFVVEFPSTDELDAWHNSEEYRSIVPLRDAGSRQRMVAYDAMAIPAR